MRVTSPARRIRGFATTALACAALTAVPPTAVPRAQTPAFTSAIAIDFDSIERMIPEFLFGQNLQTIERGEGIVRAEGNFDQQIISLLNEGKVTTLRFPGGTAADYFHWWQALGPHSRRPRQSSGYINEFYTPVVGPDEFIKIATALRAVPFVTANTGTGSAEETAAFVRFFKARGFPVVYWEIGNEVYFEGLTGNGLIGLPPDVYARRVIEYAAAIRRESPEAKIYAAGVIGPEEPDSYWNAVLLGYAGPYIDGISVHNAYFPLFAWLPNGTVPSDDYLYTAMLGATKIVERTMTLLEEQLIRLGKLIPIFVTEYDAIFFPDKTIEDPNVTNRRNPTLASALFNASVLQIMARHERVYGAHHMSMAGSRFGSLIGIDGGVHFRNPQFYVHREYAREAGHLVAHVTIDSQNATFSSGPIKLISGQTDVPMLDVLATRDPGRHKYAVFVVNRSLTSSVTASVTLDLPPGVAGTISLLTGPTFDARNDAANPTRVALSTTAFAATDDFTHTFPPHSLAVLRWAR
jgi:alpha-L-arabinofuranosidase